MKKLIAGNWKMNGTLADAKALAQAIARGLKAAPDMAAGCDFVLSPPYPHLAAVGEILKSEDVRVGLAGQDCARTENGAFTGDVSAAMLADMGCDYVIIGHSERRQYHKEDDATVAAKAALANAKGLKTIICVGEIEAEREAGTHQAVVAGQLERSLPADASARNTVIAYEPVWAIGTGKTATPEDVRDMHAFIRARLKAKLADFQDMRILYGGSVKADNAGGLFGVENVDGALIGGASLKADQYLAIAGAACEKAKAA